MTPYLKALRDLEQKRLLNHLDDVEIGAMHQLQETLLELHEVWARRARVLAGRSAELDRAVAWYGCLACEVAA